MPQTSHQSINSCSRKCLKSPFSEITPQKSPCIVCCCLNSQWHRQKRGQLLVQAMSHGPNCSSSGLPGLHELLHHVVSVTIQGDPGKIHGAFCHQRPRKLVSWSMVLSHVFVGTRQMAISCEKWWYFPMGFRAYFDTDQVVRPVALICTSISNILQHDLFVASLKPASMCPNVCRLFLSKWIFHISFFAMTLDGWHLNMANQRLIVSKTSKRLSPGLLISGFSSSNRDLWPTLWGAFLGGEFTPFFWSF